MGRVARHLRGLTSSSSVSATTRSWQGRRPTKPTGRPRPPSSATRTPARPSLRDRHRPLSAWRTCASTCLRRHLEPPVLDRRQHLGARELTRGPRSAPPAGRPGRVSPSLQADDRQPRQARDRRARGVSTATFGAAGTAEPPGSSAPPRPRHTSRGRCDPAGRNPSLTPAGLEGRWRKRPFPRPALLPDNVL